MVRCIHFASGLWLNRLGRRPALNGAQGLGWHGGFRSGSGAGRERLKIGFIQFEGTDLTLQALCLRAQAEGLRVLYDPYATLYHLESRTRGFNTDSKRQARADAANAILWARWGERFGRDPGFNPHFDRTLRPFSRLRPPPAHA